MKPLSGREVIGLCRPYVDAHTLGVSAIEQLLIECGYETVIADADLCEAVGAPNEPINEVKIENWVKTNGISRLGFSYRLDPVDGARAFGRLKAALERRNLFEENGGPIKGLYFAGLPEACRRVEAEHRDSVRTFIGDESSAETLEKFGVPSGRIPSALANEATEDAARLAFGQRLVRSEAHLKIKPVDRSGGPNFGTRREHLRDRIDHGIQMGFPPLMRAHVGPYLPDREEAVRLYIEQARQLAETGFLDVLSIGSSQLSQSHFGQDWGDLPNGGGVPVNSPEEYRAIYEAARPMLVRTYAGTRNVDKLAPVYEETINIAWHALSFWWFSTIDGRGPNLPLLNLQQHMATLEHIARTGKPFEPNIPHHFAFRGADDVSYVVSAILAARTAKRLGVRYFVLQHMLNTPRSTWGSQDIAKGRAMLALARDLEDERFRVFYQPRAGLDFFSPGLDKAKAQLASVSVLMDLVEPNKPHSPNAIHVVSYTEASHLAAPHEVDESIQITRAAIEARRRERFQEGGELEREAQERTEKLLGDARKLLATMEEAIPDLYSAKGLYDAFWAGFMPVPYLWEGRDELVHAVNWKTALRNGSVIVLDERGQPIEAEERARVATANLIDNYAGRRVE